MHIKPNYCFRTLAIWQLCLVVLPCTVSVQIKTHMSKQNEFLSLLHKL